MDIRYACALLLLTAACSDSPSPGDGRVGLEFWAVQDVRVAADCASPASGLVLGGDACYTVGPVLLSVPRAAEAGASQGPGGVTLDVRVPDDLVDDVERVTRENLNKQLVVLLNGRYVSAPTIQTVIDSGRLQLTGMFSLDEADRMAAELSG